MKTVDMHCDTISALLKKKREGKQENLADCDCHINLLKLKKGDYLLQNFALFVNLGVCRDPWQEVQELYSLYESQIQENADWIAPMRSYGELEENRAAGKLSAMLTVEEGGVCGGSLRKLEQLYEQGVRMLTLTWNYPNELGSPNLDRTGRLTAEDLLIPNERDGLTETGLAFVEHMEKLGMLVDVSHLSDAGFYDVALHAKKPFVASHSNARAICPCVRNLTDEMIRLLAERGGVTGLNFCADFLTTGREGVPNPGTIAAVVRHAQHIVRVGGMECLGLGSDFDGIDTHAELPGADAMEKLWHGLVRGGFTQSQADQIFGGNVCRLYRETLG